MRSLNCTLPWEKGQLKKCDTVEQYNTFLTMNGNLMKFGEEEFNRQMSCMPSCHRQGCQIYFVRTFVIIKYTNKNLKLIFLVRTFGNSVKRSEFEAKMISTKNINLDDKEICNVEFSYGSSRLALKEQYFTYSVADLVSDVGGYLVLLLGHSILSCFE
jgi:hypothetical protein